MNFDWIDIGLGAALIVALFAALVSRAGRTVLSEIIGHPLRRSEVARTKKGVAVNRSERLVH